MNFVYHSLQRSLLCFIRPTFFSFLKRLTKNPEASAVLFLEKTEEEKDQEDIDSGMIEVGER